MVWFKVGVFDRQIHDWNFPPRYPLKYPVMSHLQKFAGLQKRHVLTFHPGDWKQKLHRAPLNMQKRGSCRVLHSDHWATSLVFLKGAPVYLKTSLLHLIVFIQTYIILSWVGMTKHVKGGVTNERAFCGLGATACTTRLLTVLNLCQVVFLL